MLSALFTPFLTCVISTVYTFFCLCYQHCLRRFQPELSALCIHFCACVISTVHIVFSLCYQHCVYIFLPVLSALFTLFLACVYGSGCSKEVKSGSSCSQKYTCNYAIYEKSSRYFSESYRYYGLSFKVFSGYSCGNTGQ